MLPLRNPLACERLKRPAKTTQFPNFFHFFGRSQAKKIFFTKIIPFFKLILDGKEKETIINSFTSYLQKQKENLDEEIFIVFRNL